MLDKILYHYGKLRGQIEDKPLAMDCYLTDEDALSLKNWIDANMKILEHPYIDVKMFRTDSTEDVKRHTKYLTLSCGYSLYIYLKYGQTKIIIDGQEIPSNSPYWQSK